MELNDLNRIDNILAKFVKSAHGPIDRTTLQTFSFEMIVTRNTIIQALNNNDKENAQHAANIVQNALECMRYPQLSIITKDLAIYDPPNFTDGKNANLIIAAEFADKFVQHFQSDTLYNNADTVACIVLNGFIGQETLQALTKEKTFLRNNHQALQKFIQTMIKSYDDGYEFSAMLRPQWDDIKARLRTNLQQFHDNLIAAEVPLLANEIGLGLNKLNRQIRASLRITLDPPTKRLPPASHDTTDQCFKGIDKTL